MVDGNGFHGCGENDLVWWHEVFLRMMNIHAF